jgi:hypothetical protein
VSTQLTVARHLEGLRTATVAFVRYADRAGPGAPVPTCPGWTVRDLVAYQGGAHRSTAALLRGDAPVSPGVTADPVEWLRDGAIELVEAITRAPQQLSAPQFWARRACHQTTLRAVDALAAVFGRAPDPAETWIETDLAVDGIDELLTGFATRPTSWSHGDEPAVLVVSPDDAPDWWLVSVGAGRAAARRGRGPRPEVPVPDWDLHASAVELYLALWDRCAQRADDSGPLVRSS